MALRAIVAKMYLVLCKNIFDALPKCILAYIFQRKMFSCAKTHLMQKCIWCKNAFDAKMHFGVHFPKENVQQRCAKMHLMQKCIWCKNAFDAKMHFGNATRTFSFVKCSASHFTKSNVQHQQNVTNAFDAVQKCIWCKNAFDAKMHLMQKCIFATQRVHFPLENVQHHIL